jgi:predicted RNase H-like HicB family nuclease
MNNNISGSQDGIVTDKETVEQTRSYIFEVRFKRDEDGFWSAEIPALPNCRARALTKDLAYDELGIKAKEYLSTLSQQYSAVYWGNGVAILEYAAISVTF